MRTVFTALAALIFAFGGQPASAQAQSEKRPLKIIGRRGPFPKEHVTDLRGQSADLSRVSDVGSQRPDVITAIVFTDKPDHVLADQVKNLMSRWLDKPLGVHVILTDPVHWPKESLDDLVQLYWQGGFRGEVDNASTNRRLDPVLSIVMGEIHKEARAAR